MLLAKGWFKRRAPAPTGAVLHFYAVASETPSDRGMYFVERVGTEWTARFRPEGARPDARDIAIDARHPDGGPMDWPLRSCAEDACRLHAHLLDLGYGVLRAAELVASRSQRVSRGQRVETLAYGQAVRT